MEKWTIDVACKAEHFGAFAKGLSMVLTTRDQSRTGEAKPQAF